MAAKKKVVPAQRIYRSDDEKLAAVEALNARGDRSAKDVAKELGISPALLYNWRDRVTKGELGAPRNKADLEIQREVSNQLALVSAPNGNAPVVQGRSYSIDIKAELRRAPSDPQTEVVLLRAENERLKDLIESLLSAATGRRYSAVAPSN